MRTWHEVVPLLEDFIGEELGCVHRRIGGVILKTSEFLRDCRRRSLAPKLRKHAAETTYNVALRQSCRPPTATGLEAALSFHFAPTTPQLSTAMWYPASTATTPVHPAMCSASISFVAVVPAMTTSHRPSTTRPPCWTGRCVRGHVRRPGRSRTCGRP